MGGPSNLAGSLKNLADRGLWIRGRGFDRWEFLRSR